MSRQFSSSSIASALSSVRLTCISVPPTCAIMNATTTTSPPNTTTKITNKVDISSNTFLSKNLKVSNRVLAAI